MIHTHLFYTITPFFISSISLVYCFSSFSHVFASFLRLDFWVHQDFSTCKQSCFIIHGGTRKWWEPRVLRPAQWTIYCWEHLQRLVRLSWVDDGAFWLLFSNHLGLYTACITGLTCNLMSNWVRLFVIVMHSADDFTQLILQEDRNHQSNRIEERDWIVIKMWLKAWPCMKNSGPLTNPC